MRKTQKMQSKTRFLIKSVQKRTNEKLNMLFVMNTKHTVIFS